MKNIPESLICLVVCLLVASSTAPVSMKLRNDGFAKTWINVNFYGDTFTEFYRCLSRNKSLSCSAALARDIKQPHTINDRRVVFSRTIESINDDEENFYSKYFSCHFYFTDDKLICRRQPLSEVDCAARPIIQHFRLLNSTSVSCVSIIWEYRGENLIENKTLIYFCNGGCNLPIKDVQRISTTTDNSKGRTSNDNFKESTNNGNSATQSYRHSSSIHPSQHSEHDDDHDDHEHDQHHSRHPIDDVLDTKTHVILAVVIALGVGAVLVVAAALFRKKLLQKRAPLEVDDVLDNLGARRNKSHRPKKVSNEIPLRTTSVILDASKLNSYTI